MKKILTVCLMFMVASVFAEDIWSRVPVARTDNFIIYGNPDDGELLGQQMEERFALYNHVFRFDPASLANPLRVRAFSDRGEYERYVMANLGREQAGAVYLHFEDSSRRELAFCSGCDGGSDSLSYQAFIQFMRAFIPNPPAWILEGFAVFFAAVNFDKNGEMVYEENLAWLDTVKNIKPLPPLSAIMLAQTPESIKHFQALAWSLVSFFFSSGKGDYRSMVESFMVLSGDNTERENTSAVMNRISAWNSMEQITEDYLSYLQVRLTFEEMVNEGQRAYSSGRPQAAEAAFRGAMELRPGHYAPWYYLGLLAYDSGDGESAERFFRSALAYGADAGLVLYALGLNASAVGKKNEAREFLRQSAEADPARYREKAEAIRERL
ncbi:MAG: tetratricopeptide repeat protein [Treponema sp.]|jgi:tetratricopeptide (TPR) repeat protein|nr:tetratricopeptide repeat protein [Treponema sp.]